MNEHVQDAEAIFLSALEKATPAERVAYIEATCEGNVDLLRRVRELMASHDQSRGPLDSPPPGLAGMMELPNTVEIPGTMIGPYQIVQQLGEGGMGVVYLAEQTQPVHRKVALKIIKPGMDSRQVIARFEAERQALAMMDHVNIARVIDGGTTESGRPYFVMELINGVPITKYCDDNHLTPRERLELFVPVCQAIQHAHQKGIIHRDIKPSNVLVSHYDGKPVPKVIDFGVAKAIDQKLTERTLCTNIGGMVGTLEYMSPEQAEINNLGVDTRSDIYSLGALLYELLTGSTPLTREQLKNAAYAELIRILKDVEPQKPSTRLSESGESLASISALRKTEPAKLSKLMRGELDWIVMKPLEKDRNRRYETASALADDIQRYLKYESVKACPPSTWYRLSKFTRRYKVPIIATSIVMLALMISTADSLYQMFEAKKARALADERLVNETEARNLALAAVDRMLTRVADEAMPNVPQAEQVRLKLYQDAVEFYRNILRKRTDDPDLQYETAVALIRLGEMFVIVGRPELAVKEYQTAHDTLEQLHKQFPEDPRFRVELAPYFNRLIWQAYLTEEDVDRLTQRSIDLVYPVVESHPVTYEIHGIRAASTLADSIRHRAAYRVGGLNYYLTHARVINLNLGDEYQQLIKALSLCSDDSCPSLRTAANCHSTLSMIKQKSGDKENARIHIKQAVKLAQQCNAKKPASPIYRYDLGCHLLHCGRGHSSLRQLNQAKLWYEQSVDWFERLENDYPSSNVAKYQTTWARMFLAQCYFELGEYENVITQIDKIDADRSITGRIEFRPDGMGYVPGKPMNFMQWGHYRNRGEAHFHLKHFDKALEDIKKAVEMKPGDVNSVKWFNTDLAANCLDENFKKGMQQLEEAINGRKPNTASP